MTITESVLDPPGPEDSPPDRDAAPERKTWAEQILLGVFLILPLLALLAAVPVAVFTGITWRNVIISVVMYYFTGLGITVGFHRFLTHKSFKAKRPVKIVLAVAGSMALQSSPIQWVADHRRHHRFSDKDGDPHSPWRYGKSFKGVTKGFFYSHVGWLFDWDKTDENRFASDLVNDPDIARISKDFPLWVAVSLLLPPLVGGLWSWSWQGALTAFFWATLVRICLLHHVTFAINSVCHITGQRPFKTRDHSTNVWWLSLLSFGESWHNFHHAEPTSARHGVRLLEFDTSAVVIKVMEKLHLVSDVRWPDATIIARRKLVPDPVG